MTIYLAATRSRYVLIDANSESHARDLGQTALYLLYADMRQRLGKEVPIEIHTVRPASDDEIELWRWHHEMLAQEASIKRQ